MIPPDVVSEVRRLAARIEELEAEGMRLGLQTLELVKPYLISRESCEEALGVVPQGYVSFSVRRVMSEFEADPTPVPE